jgi:oxalate decarboxylase/phosphoglucose isomerase-like protein (cupin superfamily)
MRHWHKTYQDPLIGGLYVGVLGASKYILDEPGGEPITSGYHSFWMHKGTLMGSLGAKDERVVYDA